MTTGGNWIIFLILVMLAPTGFSMRNTFYILLNIGN